MTITGLVGHIGVCKQDAMIVYSGLAAYVPTIDYWFVITQESLVADNSQLVAEGEIGRGRDRTGATAGGFGISGGFGGYARVADLGQLLRMSLKNADVTADGSTGVTTITPDDYLDWWTIEKNVGDTLYLQLVNGKVNSLNISINAGEMANYTTEWVVAMEKSIDSDDASTPTYTDDDILAFHGGLIKIGGSDYTNMESIEIAIANGLSNDEYSIQPSRFLNNVTEGARTFDLNFNQVFQTATDYETYTYGQVGRSTPGYNLFEDDVYFLLMNSQEKATADQYMEFLFPRVMFGGLPVNLTNGRVVVSNTGTVLAPTSGDILTVRYK